MPVPTIKQLYIQRAQMQPARESIVNKPAVSVVAVVTHSPAGSHVPH